MEVECPFLATVRHDPYGNQMKLLHQHQWQKIAWLEQKVHHQEEFENDGEKGWPIEDMDSGWRRTHNLCKTSVLPLLLLNEMIPQPLWIKFFRNYGASVPMLANALIPWMVALKEWIPASLNLKRMWVIFVGASTFHHLPSIRLLLLSFILSLVFGYAF